MAGNIAVVLMITALGIPRADAADRLPACADPTGISPVSAPGSADIAQRTAGTDTPAPRPPVPFLRQLRPTSSSSLQQEVPKGAAEEPSQDALDMERVKAAIERDGYKRVMVLDKASNGVWRAKAYRGVAEVFVTVDADGTVTAE